MLHPKDRRDQESALATIKNSLKILEAAKDVKVVAFCLLGGGFKLDLSLGMLPRDKQNEVINFLESTLKEHRQNLSESIRKDKELKRTLESDV